jgi:putative transposase
MAHLIKALSRVYIKSAAGIRIKTECLSKLILFGEASLRRAVTQFIAHYHLERPHQGKGNQLLLPSPISLLSQHAGRIQCQERLGGLLKFYQRAA